MTREEAIEAIRGAFGCMISDYSYCRADEDVFRLQRDAALRALGVTDEEINS